MRKKQAYREPYVEQDPGLNSWQGTWVTEYGEEIRSGWIFETEEEANNWIEENDHGEEEQYESKQGVAKTAAEYTWQVRDKPGLPIVWYAV